MNANAKYVCLIYFLLLTGDGDLKDGVTYQQMQVSFSERENWINN